MVKERKPIDPLNVARVIGMLGGTNAELAAALGISPQALTKRKGKNPALVATLKEAKAKADSQVEQALFKRATGYSHPDTHFSSYEGEVTATPYTKHYAPDPVSCIFWLKNRKPAEWRDRADLRVEGEIAGVPDVVLSGLRKIALETMRNGH